MLIRIKGNWKKGLALDLHTKSSVYLGPDELGHERFDTTRTEIGELVFELKYRGNKTVIPRIVGIIKSNITGIKTMDAIVPVPASKKRAVQPVHLIADALGADTGVRVVKDEIMKTRQTPELKGIRDPAERERILKDAFSLRGGYDFTGMKVLLVDDLFRSGATLRAITSVIKEQGRTEDIYVLALTKTRSNR